METSGGMPVHVARAEWYFEPPESNGDFVVFTGLGSYHLLNHRDMLDAIEVEQPKQPTPDIP